MAQQTRKKNIASGFTLVEALVAISILLIAIASPMTIAQKGLMDATLSRNEMTASFLAQDAIEGVKNIRDYVALNGTPANSASWLCAFDGSSPCTFANSGGPVNCMCAGASCPAFPSGANYCNIDTVLSGSLPFLVASTSARVNPLDATTANGHFSAYVLTGTPNTGTPAFYRQINIVRSPSASSPNPNEAEVNVRVYWNTPSGLQSVTISDFMYNYSANL